MPRAAQQSYFTDFKQEETRTRQVFPVSGDLLDQIVEVKRDQTIKISPADK